MTKTEEQLLDSLLDLERAAAAMASAEPKPDLRPIFARLDQLESELPSDAPRELRHYLQRKSYQKAREFLQHR